MQLLSGNEAMALGAYHAGVQVAAAYPGTPSTEILENLSRFKDIYAEWSTNEKVAMEVALGAAYTGARAMVSMKHVGLNVASDPFMAASITGVVGGLVVVTADDPQIHSSQNEQDNRHYARLAKVPMLEPTDSQDAYDIMGFAFDISEQFDTPVLVRTTTRISHSKSAVEVSRHRVVKNPQPAFYCNVPKYVMLPVNALPRHALVEKRMLRLAEYTEISPLNQIMWGKRETGIVTSGVAYQYAREVFPEASFLKLGMTWPLPEKMIKEFAGQVDRLIVIEELDPFLQDNIKSMGIEVTGKEYIPLVGELNARIVAESCAAAGLLPESEKEEAIPSAGGLPRRPPLLCPGCPHTGIYFVLNSIGQRSRLVEHKNNGPQEPKLIITGDIGCYTLGAYPPLNVLDTTACMGAGIGQALGMEKAGVKSRIVAVIGDSTFLHSGITGLVNAVYNSGHITILILDNRTTAMTGHQEHPGTGVSAQGEQTFAVDIEALVRGIGVKDVKVINAFDIKALRAGVRDSLERPEVSVIIVRGSCAMLVRKRAHPRTVDIEKCDRCGVCLRLGCPAIQTENGRVFIEPTLCAGDICTVCEQLCPEKAIHAEGSVKS
ncbi:MAG: indolepyruvate ferredoxin oxidoreductase subunit alpha [Chloroflexi bacterium RBG_16_56_11]|nr:MAG: indolepyruvate ferredoxin oxidoreductase subunit alpha [Chloroflexi bacterium RBG_16_56_11]